MTREEFLIQNDAYEKYINNVKEFSLPDTDKTSAEYLNQLCDGFISRSFAWYLTKEGLDFWEKLNYEALYIYETVMYEKNRIKEEHSKLSKYLSMAKRWAVGSFKV